MYEICRLLARPKIKKPRKAQQKRITIGTRVYVGYGDKQGIVVEKHPNGKWWNVKVDGMEELYGFDRSIMKAI